MSLKRFLQINFALWFYGSILHFMKSIKVIVVDSNLFFRKTLVKFLVEEFYTVVIAELNDIEELLTTENLFKVDIVFVNGTVFNEKQLDVIVMTLWNYPLMKFISILTIRDYRYLQNFVEVGIKGFIDNDNLFNEIRNALENVMDGQFFFSECIVTNLKVGK